MIWEVSFINIVEEKWIVEVQADNQEEAIRKAAEWETIGENLERRENMEMKYFNAHIIEE